MPTAAVVSFRLGLPDGVSVVAASWARALGELGFDVRTVAGEGEADVTVPWLTVQPGRRARPRPGRRRVRRRVRGHRPRRRRERPHHPRQPARLACGGRGTARSTGPAAPPRPAVAAAVAGVHHRAPRRRPVLAPRRHQPLHARRVRWRGASRPRPSTTGSTPTLRSGDRAGMRRRLERRGRRAAPAAPGAGHRAQERPRGSRPGRGHGWHLLAARPGRGRLRAHPRRTPRRPPGRVSCAAPSTPTRSPTPTRRATPCSSRRPGRGSATLRWKRPPTASRSWSATTRSPTSCAPSASSGWSPTAPTRWPRRWPRPTTPRSTTTAPWSRAHCSFDAMRDNLAGVLAAAGWLP